MADLESSKDRKEERREDTNPSTIIPPPAPINNAVARYADISPNKRYLRWNEVILQSQNSVQSSYKAFDTKNGIEVVWHSINLNSLDETEQNRIVHCVNIVKKIQNKYVIEYQSSWFTAETRTLHIITSHLERLDEFIGKVKTLRWRIIKKWAKQILRGLSCLHASTPVIVHRNLTCSHIYINGGTSHTNIGDLWMGSVLDESEPPSGSLLSESMVSAYTAPEDILSPKLDIYSFGMCVLMMVSREEPYAECQGNLEKVRRYATQGRPPRALSHVNHPLALQFIQSCLQSADQRPAADVLLEHEFLSAGPDDDDEVLVPTKSTEQELDTSESNEASELIQVSSSSCKGITLVDSSSSRSENGVTSEQIGVASASASSSKQPPLSVPETSTEDQAPSETKGDTPASDLVSSTGLRSPLSPAISVSKTPNALSPVNSIPRPASLVDVMNAGSSQKSSHNSISNSGSSNNNSDNIAINADESTQSVLSRNDSFANTTPADRQQDIILKLGRQLADFDQSENMHMDKGVHDGRNADEDGTGTHNETQQLPRPVQEPGLDRAQSSTQLPLKLIVPAQRTREKQADQAVEFIFDVMDENIEGVAAEMIEELGIEWSVRELADRINSLVHAAIDRKLHSLATHVVQAFVAKHPRPPPPPVEVAPAYNGMSRNLSASASVSVSHTPTISPSASIASFASAGILPQQHVGQQLQSRAPVSQSQSSSCTPLPSPQKPSLASPLGSIVSFQADAAQSITEPSVGASSNASESDGNVQPLQPSPVFAASQPPSIPSTPPTALRTPARALSPTGLIGSNDVLLAAIPGSLAQKVLDSRTLRATPPHVPSNSSKLVLSMEENNRIAAASSNLASPVASTQIPSVSVADTTCQKSPVEKEKPASTASVSASVTTVDPNSGTSSVEAAVSTNSLTDGVSDSELGMLSSDATASSVPTLAIDPTVPSTEAIETNRSRAHSSRSALDVLDPGDDAAHLELQQEIEKVEKESRAARRAFEQRIQKHKIIQEKCEEDLRLLEEEHHTRAAEIRRKQETTLSRKDEEIARAQAELATRLAAFKERKRLERAQLRVLTRKAKQTQITPQIQLQPQPQLQAPPQPQPQSLNQSAHQAPP